MARASRSSSVVDVGSNSLAVIKSGSQQAAFHKSAIGLSVVQMKFRMFVSISVAGEPE